MCLWLLAFVRNIKKTFDLWKDILKRKKVSIELFGILLINQRDQFVQLHFLLNAKSSFRQDNRNKKKGLVVEWMVPSSLSDC